MVQWFKCSGSIYMTDDSFTNNDYSHINTKYNAKRIEQCYEIYWYSVNMITKKKKRKIAFIFHLLHIHQTQKERVNMLILTV